LLRAMSSTAAGSHLRVFAEGWSVLKPGVALGLFRSVLGVV
jgi:hypothetical protein